MIDVQKAYNCNFVFQLTIRGIEKKNVKKKANHGILYDLSLPNSLSWNVKVVFVQDIFYFFTSF